MIRKKSALVAATLGAMLISGVAVSSSWAGTPEEEKPAEPALQVEPDLRVLSNQTRSASDALPSIITDSENNNDLLLDTARSLKSSDESNKYWVVRNQEGQVCMVAWTPEDVAGTTCANPEDFNQGGLALQVVAQDHATEGYLFPDSVAKANNLVNVNPFDSKKSEVQSKAFDLAGAKARGLQFDVLTQPSFVPGGLQKMAAGQ